MKACNQWREELLEAALGGALAPAAKKHVAGCAACAASLDALCAQNAAIDAGVAWLVRGEEPRAGFEQRVLAAVDGREHSQAQRGGFAWARLAAVAAACAAAAVFLARTPQPPAPKPPSLSGWQSPTDGLLRSASDGILRPELRLGEFYFSPPAPPEKKSESESKRTRSKFI